MKQVSQVVQAGFVATINQMSEGDYSVVVELNGVEVELREEFTNELDVFDWAWAYVCNAVDSVQDDVVTYESRNRQMSYTARSMFAAKEEIGLTYGMDSQWIEEMTYLAGILIAGAYIS